VASRPLATAAETRRGNQADDALLALNDASRVAYRRARQEALARCGPAVLVEGDELVLAYGLYRSTAHVTPDLYWTLKGISHVPPLLSTPCKTVAAAKVLDDKRLYVLKQSRDLVAGKAGRSASLHWPRLPGNSLRPRARFHRLSMI
jgi:hypothetical protein